MKCSLIFNDGERSLLITMLKSLRDTNIYKIYIVTRTRSYQSTTSVNADRVSRFDRKLSEISDFDCSLPGVFNATCSIVRYSQILQQIIKFNIYGCKVGSWVI